MEPKVRAWSERRRGGAWPHVLSESLCHLPAPLGSRSVWVELCLPSKWSWDRESPPGWGVVILQRWYLSLPPWPVA